MSNVNPNSSSKKLKIENEQEEKQLLEELVSCQNDIDALKEKAKEEKRVVSAKYKNILTPHFARRSEITKNIPYFWVTVFNALPRTSALEDSKERDFLMYLTNLEVENIEQSDNYKIHFFFKENPYIENEILTKEFFLDDGDFESSNITPIRWKNKNLLNQNTGSTTHGRKIQLDGEAFFDWFCSKKTPLLHVSKPNTFAVLLYIKDIIWKDPLSFYLLGTNEEDSEDGNTLSDIEGDAA